MPKKKGPPKPPDDYYAKVRAYVSGPERLLSESEQIAWQEDVLRIFGGRFPSLIDVLGLVLTPPQTPTEDWFFKIDIRDVNPNVAAVVGVQIFMADYVHVGPEWRIRLEDTLTQVRLFFAGRPTEAAAMRDAVQWAQRKGVPIPPRLREIIAMGEGSDSLEGLGAIQSNAGPDSASGTARTGLPQDTAPTTPSALAQGDSDSDAESLERGLPVRARYLLAAYLALGACDANHSAGPSAVMDVLSHNELGEDEAWIKGPQRRLRTLGLLKGDTSVGSYLTPSGVKLAKTYPKLELPPKARKCRDDTAP